MPENKKLRLICFYFIFCDKKAFFCFFNASALFKTKKPDSYNFKDLVKLVIYFKKYLISDNYGVATQISRVKNKIHCPGGVM